jgi:PAS domain S-box-containing protein
MISIVGAGTRDREALEAENRQLVEDNKNLRHRIAELEAVMPRPREQGEAASHGDSRTLDDRAALLDELESTVKVGTWVWEIPTDTVTWSRELYRILGYDPEVDEASSENYFAAIHPEDADFVREDSARQVREGSSSSQAVRVRWKDGTVRQVISDGRLIFEDGNLVRAVGTVLDVTDSHQREKELHRVAAALNDAQQVAMLGSWQLDFRTGIIHWSDQLCRFIDVPPGTKADTELFFSKVHEDDRRLLRERFKHLREHKPPPPTEFRIVRDNGEVRYFSTVTEKICEGETVVGMHGSLIDVTERRELERQLNQAQKMEAIGRLAGGLAHDFNNLLTVISISVDRLRREIDRRELEDIAAAADAAAAMTRQLLTFSRQVPAAPRPVSITALLESTLALVRRLIGEDIEVSLHTQPDVWSALADANQVQQVLLNLAVNARDAMPKGGTLEFATRNTTRDGTECVAVTVKDSGYGMNEEMISKVFEPFFTTKEHGTGLGLSTAFGMMSRMGGLIEVESTPGEGALFTLLLPRSPETEAAVHSDGSESEEGGPEAVLLVEDNELVRELLARVLRRAGYEVIEADNARAAHAQWKEYGGQITALVTDVVMPGMNGRDLADLLRAEAPSLKVLLMTGYAPQEIARDDLQYHLLQKPFTPAVFLEEIRRILDDSDDRT